MKKLSAIVLTALFAAMQVAIANPIDTGVGTINSATGGFAGLDPNSTNNNVGLNFNGNSHLNWDTLNVGKDQVLNFNANSGVNGITVLNTVNRGMTTVYGQINSNSGIANLIISNPNGVLFDGAHFTTAGDLLLTTQDMSNVTLDDLSAAKFTKLYENGKLIPIQIKNGSEFKIGGDYTIVAAGINAANSTITAKTIKLVTANGQDFLALATNAPAKNETVTKLTAMNINGDLYITNDVGALEIRDGGVINGNTNIDTTGDVFLNKNGNNKLVMNGDVDVKGNSAQMFLRNADVNGNLNMTNGGGFLDIGNVNVTKNATLTTENKSQNGLNCSGAPVRHFVHVIGDTTVGGDLTVESENNIHIGGYDYDKSKLAPGSLTVGGDLNAHAVNGHITTTIDTKADKISLKSDNYNVLTDGKATLTAKEYEFSANGYIGGLTNTEHYTVDEVVKAVMEGYQYIPNSVQGGGNINIAGGNITKLETPSTANILSKGDVKLTGADARTINITAPNSYMEIAGDVHAKEINVGKETDKLKLDYEGRDFTVNYTNIKDNKVVTIQGNEEITYNSTDAQGGNNDGVQVKGENTYLIGPGKPADDDPVVPPTPVDPDPINPDPINPDPINPDDNENVKVLRSFENHGLDLNQVQTPVAYAADLDDDNLDTGVRKNVDGSVTVVRAFPMIN